MGWTPKQRSKDDPKFSANKDIVIQLATRKVATVRDRVREDGIWKYWLEWLSPSVGHSWVKESELRFLRKAS